MRITIRLDDELFAQVKHLAAPTGRSLSALIEDALREMLSRQQIAARRDPVSLTTVSGRGLQDGVDVDDSASLLDLMDHFQGPDQHQHGEEGFRR